MTINGRYDEAIRIASNAAQTALKHFRVKDALTIESKGAQDWVSNADREVELEVRDAIASAYPDDGIIGEEYDNVVGRSGFDWIIDPIDGTTSFVNGIPGWCVVIACVRNGNTVLGVVIDPIANEVFSASDELGALLNGEPISVTTAVELTAGSVAVGHSTRVDYEQSVRMLSGLMSGGGMFFRTGSGALMLAYVAAGRLLGFVEPHMNAWDCVAALYIITKAGGTVEPFDMDAMLENGGRVVAGGPNIYPKLQQLVEASYE